MGRKLWYAFLCKTHHHDYVLWASEFKPGGTMHNRVACSRCGDCIYESSHRLPPVPTDKGDW